ncbi:MAG: hypothetical protein M3534_05645, partial [Actinomycetota bacterium]|nr:hypothetical protein [Actinomycetota bacterium]
RELAAVRDRQERIEQLEQEASTLLERYAGMVPEALDALTPEERHRVYKMMRLNVVMSADGLAKVTGTFGDPSGMPEDFSMKTVGTSSNTATSRTSRRRVTGRRTASR